MFGSFPRTKPHEFLDGLFVFPFLTPVAHCLASPAPPMCKFQGNEIDLALCKSGFPHVLNFIAAFARRMTLLVYTT
jgi:hypothetical protein